MKKNPKKLFVFDFFLLVSTLFPRLIPNTLMEYGHTAAQTKKGAVLF